MIPVRCAECRRKVPWWELSPETKRMIEERREREYYREWLIPACSDCEFASVGTQARIVPDGIPLTSLNAKPSVPRRGAFFCRRCKTEIHDVFVRDLDSPIIGFEGEAYRHYIPTFEASREYLLRVCEEMAHELNPETYGPSPDIWKGQAKLSREVDLEKLFSDGRWCYPVVPLVLYSWK